METSFTYQAELRSIDPDRNRFRCYVVTVGSTPTGEYILSTWRGRIGSRLRDRHATFSSLGEVLEEVAQLLHRRVRHGYRFAA